MPGQYTETAFEAAIEHFLLTSGGYGSSSRDEFDLERGIEPASFLAFVRETQPDEWLYLQNIQKDKAEETLLYIRA